MSDTTLHPALQRFVDKHRATTVDHKRAAHDQLRPILGMASTMLAHLNALQQELTAAELEEHDHALDGTLNFMHTRLKGAQDKCAEFIRVGRELAQIYVEVARGLESDIEAANRILNGPDAMPTVNAEPALAAEVDPVAQQPNKLELRGAAKEAAKSAIKEGTS
jgi:hypothetical protein